MLMKTRSRRPRRIPRPHYPTLAAYLAGSGDTQARIAQRVGASQAYVSRIVSGQAIPRPLLAARLAEYANIPLDSFQRVYLAKHGPGRAA